MRDCCWLVRTGWHTAPPVSNALGAAPVPAQYLLGMRLSHALLALPLAATTAAAQNADWPVYHGNDDHTHYSRLSQISPANVKQLKVAWTFDTGDAFPGSEMQANPIVIDGVMYATTPKLQVFALDASSGKQLWRF
ncbi:MAG: hypothetical protein RLY69_1111, partial [Verrucomicrobiota bacterium]